MDESGLSVLLELIWTFLIRESVIMGELIRRLIN